MIAREQRNLLREDDHMLASYTAEECQTCLVVHAASGRQVGNHFELV